MIFKYNGVVDVHDIDFNGVARASALMKYIQSAAEAQLSANNMSYDELRDMGRAFILSRITMEFTEPLRAFQRFDALTFPCESRGFGFLRCYAIEHDGERIGRAAAVWALIDTKTKKLIRTDKFELGLELHEPHALAVARLNLPSALKKVGEYTVTYGDVDRNMHMNNTRYPDVYSTFLPISGKRIHTMTISYLNEAPLGDRLSVYLSEGEGGIYFVRTVRSDGLVNSEAEILLTDIV